MIGSFNDETNFPSKLLVTNTQIRKAFANVSSANIKFPKTQLVKMIQSGGFPLYEGTGSLIKVLKSCLNLLIINQKVFWKIKIKVLIQWKQLKGIESIKKLFEAEITLTNN